MDKVKLKIAANIISVSENDEQLRYNFRISPLTIDSPVFTFFHYVWARERNKRNANNARAKIAQQLRVKHRATWQRYHDWMDDDNTRERRSTHSIARLDTRRAR